MSKAQEIGETESASQLIDTKIASIGDWRGRTLARMRALIKQADSKIVESVKWRKPSNPSGVPVWEYGGILCTGEAFKDKVKITFAKGAKLNDPARLFNASLGSATAVEITPILIGSRAGPWSGGSVGSPRRYGGQSNTPWAV